MKTTLRTIIWVLFGFTLIAATQGCKAGQLPFGDEPKEELKFENALPPPAKPEAAVPETTIENVETQAPPTVARVPVEINLEARPIYPLTRLPDDSEATMLFCLDGRKAFATKIWVELMKTPTIAKFVENLESNAGVNVESPYLWSFACSASADNDCDQKLLVVKPLEPLTFASVDSHEKEGMFYAATKNRFIMASKEALMTDTLEKRDIFPAIPDDSIAVLIAKSPAKVLQKLDFFKVDVAAAAQVQKLVAFLKISPDNNPQLEVTYYAGNNVVGTAVIKLNSALIDWGKFFDMIKSEDSKTDVDSTDKPKSDYKAQ